MEPPPLRRVQALMFSIQCLVFTVQVHVRKGWREGTVYIPASWARGPKQGTHVCCWVRLRYKPVNFGAEKRPGSPTWCVRIDCDRALTRTALASSARINLDSQHLAERADLLLQLTRGEVLPLRAWLVHAWHKKHPTQWPSKQTWTENTVGINLLIKCSWARNPTTSTKQRNGGFWKADWVGFGGVLARQRTCFLSSRAARYCWSVPVWK